MTPALLVIRPVVLALAGAAILLFVDAIRDLARARRGRFAEAHHLYWGSAFLLAPPAWGAGALLSWCLALFLVWDDALQHHEQLSNPRYLSPVHRWWCRVAVELYTQTWLPRWLRELIVR